MTMIIDDRYLTDAERLRFMRSLECEPEPARDDNYRQPRIVSRDALQGCAPMESEVQS